MVPLHVRLRAAIEAAPYETPKLAVVAHQSLNGTDFASRLDRAVERSRRAQVAAPKLLEDLRFKPSEPEPADDPH
jgi:hypothetical protein